MKMELGIEIEWKLCLGWYNIAISVRVVTGRDACILEAE